MFNFQIGKLKYKYLVGSYTVGIITPSRQKYFRTIDEVQKLRTKRQDNGTADGRLTASEVAAYVLKHKLV